MNKRETHIVTGMTRDMSVSRFDNKFVVDARNIRITSTKGNSTLLSVTNEKGTGEFSIDGEIEGIIIGHAVLNKTLVLFTTDSDYDRIYRLDFADDFSSADVSILFEGDLEFDYNHPLETLPYYETNDIQKVYWVDGINQPRVIDIERGRQYNSDAFNFNRKIEGKQTFKVTKYNTGGEFPAGTVQYCFNYFNKFGQETNIVDVSPLYYLCPRDKGLPADGIDTSSFVIEINGADKSYECLRLYAIIRTSENATPNVRIVGDYAIQSTRDIREFTSVDGNTETLDPEDIDIIDITSGKTLYKLSDRYNTSIAYNTIDVPVTINEYAYDRSTGKIYGTFLGDAKTSFLRFYRNDSVFALIPGPLNSVVKYSTFVGTSSVNNIIAVDNGIKGSTIDAEALLFIGGQDIIAGTMSSKGNTLFLGNIKQNVPNIGELELSNFRKLKEEIKGRAESCLFDYYGNERDTVSANTDDDIKHVSGKSYYDYPIDNNRSSYDIKSFKAREGYRLGIIAQYDTGQWSEVVWVGDLDEELSPGRTVFYNDNNNLSWGPSYRKPGFKLTIPQNIIAALKNAGFIRVAPVVVYPNTAERKVLCQGVLCGSVFNVNDRYDNTPFAQSDWRFRSGYSWERIDSELQCNPIKSAPQYPIAYENNQLMSSEDFVKIFNTQYYRDPSVISFYSPDIEVDDALSSTNLSDARLRIVGISNLGFDSNHSAVGAESVAESYIYGVTNGAYPKWSKASEYRKARNKSLTQIDFLYDSPDLSYSGFIDGATGNVINEHQVLKKSLYVYKYTTFLWHRTGSLNNQPAPTDEVLKSEGKRTALYSKKCTAEARYARTTFFQNSVGPQAFELLINAPKVIDEPSSMSLFDYGASGKKVYYGNVNKVLVPPFEDIPVTTTINSGTGSSAIKAANGYPIEVCGVSDDDLLTYFVNELPGNFNWIYTEKNLLPEINDVIQIQGRDQEDPDVVGVSYSNDPIELKYKTVKHLVFGLTVASPSDTEIYQFGDSISDNYQMFWSTTGISDYFVNVLDNKLDDTYDIYSGLVNNSILVGELFRQFTDEQLASRFGGTSDESLSNNVWMRCGDSVYLDEVMSLTLYYKEGDTYIGRYDCLKTYPYTNEDTNQLVDIYSTELESRVNLDERYDKLRGSLENTFVRPTNFNLFNHPGYEQTNQYFTYKAIDYLRYRNNKYPNLVTFSLEKKPGADVDAWTSIPMTSTFDLRGDLGEVTKLTTFGDHIFSFQNRGVAQILFNERVQIPASDGQPIEITNGLKYGGYRYLSDQIGLTNKWSLATTPNGIYFIDDEKNTLYQFGGQQFQDLSGKAGFRTWLSDNNSYSVWNPVDYGNIRTWYDKLNGDLYFMSKNESLVFSEQIGNFISFMDYANLPIMVNMNDRFLTATTDSEDSSCTLWELWAGNYNMFFGTYKPYWLTFISNADPTVDKVFDNLAWRTVDYNEEGILQPLNTFDTLRVWHEHQDSGNVILTNTPGKPSPLKKKFNVFRALVPRDRLGQYAKVGRDRIRNTWTYVQLSRYTSNTDLMVFNDLDVDFFE